MHRVAPVYSDHSWLPSVQKKFLRGHSKRHVWGCLGSPVRWICAKPFRRRVRAEVQKQ